MPCDGLGAEQDYESYQQQQGAYLTYATSYVTQEQVTQTGQLVSGSGVSACNLADEVKRCGTCLCIDVRCGETGRNGP